MFDQKVPATAAPKTPALSATDYPTIAQRLLNSDAKKPDVKTFAASRQGLLFMLDGLQKNTPLSVDFILALHKSSVPDTNGGRNIPGEFRKAIISNNPNDSKKFTVAGILEWIQIIRQESVEGFAQHKSTWFGPYDPNTGTMSLDKSIRHDNLQEKQGVLTDNAFARQLYAAAQTDGAGYHVLFPRFNSQCQTMEEYMKAGLAEKIADFNKNIILAKSPDAKLRLIVEFIKKCLRHHPFYDANHRVFAVGLFNFLLLNYGIGFCPLSHRHCFLHNGLEETLAIVQANLIPLKPEAIASFCAALKKAINSYTLEEPAKKPYVLLTVGLLIFALSIIICAVPGLSQAASAGLVFYSLTGAFGGILASLGIRELKINSLDHSSEWQAKKPWLLAIATLLLVIGLIVLHATGVGAAVAWSALAVLSIIHSSLLAATLTPLFVKLQEACCPQTLICCGERNPLAYQNIGDNAYGISPVKSGGEDMSLTATAAAKPKGYDPTMVGGWAASGVAAANPRPSEEEATASLHSLEH